MNLSEIVPQSEFGEFADTAAVSKSNTYPADDVPLLPLTTAAQAVGLSVYAFAKGVDTGQIPVPILKIGRLRFVKRETLANWLFSPANADLF